MNLVRHELLMPYLLSRNSVNVIASFVSPYRSSRDSARKLIENLLRLL